MKIGKTTLCVIFSSSFFYIFMFFFFINVNFFQIFFSNWIGQFKYILDYYWKSNVKSSICSISSWGGLVKPSFESSLVPRLDSEGKGQSRVQTLRARVSKGSRLKAIIDHFKGPYLLLTPPCSSLATPPQYPMLTAHPPHCSLLTPPHCTNVQCTLHILASEHCTLHTTYTDWACGVR